MKQPCIVKILSVCELLQICYKTYPVDKIVVIDSALLYKRPSCFP